MESKPIKLLPPVLLGDRDSHAINQAQVFLQNRIKQLGLTQIQIATYIDKRQAWVSSELYKNPQQAILNLLASEPHKLERFVELLDWPLNELMGHLNIFVIKDQFATHNTEVENVIELPFFSSIDLLDQFSGATPKPGAVEHRKIDIQMYKELSSIGITRLGLLRLQRSGRTVYVEPDLHEFLCSGVILLIEFVSSTSKIQPADIVIQKITYPKTKGTHFTLTRSIYQSTQPILIDQTLEKAIVIHEPGIRIQEQITHQNLAVVRRVLDIDLQQLIEYKIERHQKTISKLSGQL